MIFYSQKNNGNVSQNNVLQNFNFIIVIGVIAVAIAAIQAKK
tara:strand:- start:1058 stop:1183 length:126 start_codon:yes stop_codon:yes gene_type:complete